jgi:hypothetical protein
MCHVIAGAGREQSPLLQPSVLASMLRRFESFYGGALAMTGSPEPRWVLQIPFITAPGFTLAEGSATTFGGLQAELLPAGADHTRIVVSGIETESAARALFESLRTGLLVGSLNISWGVRVRNEVRTLNLDSPLPDEVDMPLIYPEGKDLSRLLIRSGVVQTQFDKVLPRLLASLEFGLTSARARQAMTDDRVSLAFELYVDSYFEISDWARFLGLVGVLEVLKDKDTASDGAQSLITKWSQEANTLDYDEAVSMQGSLRYLRLTSISRGIGSVVGRHLGQDRVKEAQELYMARSKLIHDGIRSADSAGTVRRARQIVMDLLAHILVAGSL